MNFHRDLMDDRDRDEAERDIGLIVCRDGPEDAALGTAVARAALEARPDDVPAWEAKGFALGLLRRGEEGLDAFRRRSPSNPTGNPRSRERLTSPPRQDVGRTPSPTGNAPSPSALGVRTTAPSWHLSTSRIATGGRLPRPAGRPFALTPRTSRSGNCSSAVNCVSATLGPRGPNSRPFWHSTHQTVMNSSAGSSRHLRPSSTPRTPLPPRGIHFLIRATRSRNRRRTGPIRTLRARLVSSRGSSRSS